MGESEPESAAVPWRSSTVQVVLVSTILAPLGVPLVAPALPVVRDAFGIGDAQASLLVSTYFVTGIVLSPFIGMLADNVSLFVAYALKYEFAFSVVTSFLVLPVLFASNAFVPTSFMPEWLGTIADLNPVSIAISGMRALALDGWIWTDVAPAAGLLVVLAVGLGTLTAWTFTRTLENEGGLIALVVGR